MSSDLIVKKSIYKEDKRMVLIEKTEIHYYGMSPTGACIEQCAVYERDVWIGSSWCIHCKHSLGYNSIDSFIMCKKLSRALGKTDQDKSKETYMVPHSINPDELF